MGEGDLSEDLLLVNEDPDDERFYTLAELEGMEEEFSRQASAYGGNSNNPHVLLTAQSYRAKLYFLNKEMRWLDIGTGHFRILLSKDGLEHYMQIVSEASCNKSPRKSSQSSEDEAHPPADDEFTPEIADEDALPQILHRSFISSHQDFQRQRDTIITWQDKKKHDFALSF